MIIKSATTQSSNQILRYVACLNLTTVDYDEMINSKCMHTKKKTTIGSAR